MAETRQAIDALTRAVDAQKAQREAAKRAAEQITAERASADVSRETSEISK